MLHDVGDDNSTVDKLKGIDVGKNDDNGDESYYTHVNHQGVGVEDSLPPDVEKEELHDDDLPSSHRPTIQRKSTTPQRQVIGRTGG